MGGLPGATEGRVRRGRDGCPVPVGLSIPCTSLSHSETELVLPCGTKDGRTD